MKKIRLNESQFNRLVAKCVKKVLNEAKGASYQIVWYYGDSGVDDGNDGFSSMREAYKYALAQAKWNELDKNRDGFIIVDVTNKLVVRRWGWVNDDEIFSPNSGYIWKC